MEWVAHFSPTLACKYVHWNNYYLKVSVSPINYRLSSWWTCTLCWMYGCCVSCDTIVSTWLMQACVIQSEQETVCPAPSPTGSSSVKPFFHRLKHSRSCSLHRMRKIMALWRKCISSLSIISQLQFSTCIFVQWVFSPLVYPPHLGFFESSWPTATPFGQYGTVQHPLRRQDVNDFEKKTTAFNLSNPPRESDWEKNVYICLGLQEIKKKRWTKHGGKDEMWIGQVK